MPSALATAYLAIRVDRSQMTGEFGGVRNQLLAMVRDVASVAGGILSANLVAKLGSGLAGGLKSLVGQSVSANAELSRFRVTLNVLLGDEKKAGELMKQMISLSAETPFEFAGLLSGIVRLRQAGVEAQRLIPIMQIIGNAAAAAPSGFADASDRIALAIGQILANGRLMGQEVNQLVNAGIPVWKILAEQSGKSIQQIRQQIKSQAITGQQAIDLLLAGMEKRYGGVMLAQSRQFDGLLSTLRDKWKLFAAEAGKPIFDSVLGNLRSVVDLFNGDGPMRFARQIASGLTSVLSIVSNIRQTISGALSGEMLTGFLSVGSLAAEVLGNLLRMFTQFGSGVATIFGFVNTSAGSSFKQIIASATQMARIVLTDLAVLTSNGALAFDFMVASIKLKFFELRDAWRDVMQSIGNLAYIAGAAIYAGFSGMFAKIAVIWNGLRTSSPFDMSPLNEAIKQAAKMPGFNRSMAAGAAEAVGNLPPGAGVSENVKLQRNRLAELRGQLEAARQQRLAEEAAAKEKEQAAAAPGIDEPMASSFDSGGGKKKSSALVGIAEYFSGILTAGATTNTERATLEMRDHLRQIATNGVRITNPGSPVPPVFS